MLKLLDTVVDADVEVRRLAKHLSDTLPESEQELNYRLLKPVIEAVRSPSPPSRGRRTSTTPPLFPAFQSVPVSPEDTVHLSHIINYIDTMPPLSRKKVVELDSDLEAQIEALLPSNSAQQRRSFTSNSTTEGRSLSIEKELDDSDEDTNTTYGSILSQAKDDFRDKKPDFVVVGSKGTSKLVDLGDGQTGEITFEPWGCIKNQGFWVLEDNYGERQIVKYFSGAYYAWRSTAEGFADDPTAWPEKSRRSLWSFTKDVGGSDDFSDEEVLANGSRKPIRSGLRKKTWTQKHPYSVDKEIHAAAKKGKVKRKSDIDTEQDRRPQPKKSVRGVKDSHTLLTLGRPCQKMQKLKPKSQFTPTAVKAKTTVLTKLKGDPIPFYLSDCPDADALWEKAISVWDGEYEGEVKSMSIRFPWLGPEHNIKLKPGFTGSYEKMIEEIQDAPVWKDGTEKCTVEIVLIVK